MNSQGHRKKIGKRVIVVAISSIIAASQLTLNTTAIDEQSSYAISVAYQEIVHESIVDISLEEYHLMLKMTMSEAGSTTEELMNACAASAINLHNLINDETLEDTLTEEGRYSYQFRDAEGVWRETELADVNAEVIEAVNSALSGKDCSEGRIGFFAPDRCSKEVREYMYEHTSGYKPIENVIFYEKWV